MSLKTLRTRGLRMDQCCERPPVLGQPVLSSLMVKHRHLWTLRWWWFAVWSRPDCPSLWSQHHLCPRGSSRASTGRSRSERWSLNSSLYLCSSTRHIARWCCPQWCWGRRCGLRAGSLRSPGEAGSPGSARCHRTTSPARSCPGRPSRPGEAAPRWPAAPRGTRSGLRPTPETTCRRPRSGRLHHPVLLQSSTHQTTLWGPSSHSSSLQLSTPCVQSSRALATGPNSGRSGHPTSRLHSWRSRHSALPTAGPVWPSPPSFPGRRVGHQRMRGRIWC